MSISEPVQNQKRATTNGNSQHIARTRPIYTETVATESKDLPASDLDRGLWEISLLADMFYEFYRDLLYQLKRNFPMSMILAIDFSASVAG